MIGKQEWNEMAQQVHSLETKMESVYDKLANQVSDSELQEVFVQLSHDEQQHALMISKIANQIMKS